MVWTRCFPLDAIAEDTWEEIVMVKFDPDDIPELSEHEKNMCRVVVCHRGYVFCFNYGTLILVYPE